MSRDGPAYMGLWQERSAAISNLQTIMSHITSELNAAQLAVLLEILDGYWNRFQDAQRRLLLDFSYIEMVYSSMEPTEQSTKRLYMQAKGTLLQLQQKLTAEQPVSRAIRASEIKIPTFSGKYTEWAAWRSEFKAKVLDSRLDVADKITILLGALTKEAANCAGRAERLDEIELQRIWAKLDRTYDNKYQQVYAHIAKIVNIAPILRPSAEKLRAMIDLVDQHLRMLKRFNIETEHWGPLVCVLLLGKLDVETRNHWESKDTLPEMPDLNALFAYLEQRILAIRNVEMSERRTQNSSAPSGQGTHRNSVVATSFRPKVRYQPYDNRHPDKENATARAADSADPPTCKQCNNGQKHFLWHCDVFKQLSHADKLKNIEKWHVCEVCLVANHKASDCKKGMCPRCKKGQHNSLICPQDNDRRIRCMRYRYKRPDKQ